MYLLATKQEYYSHFKTEQTHKHKDGTLYHVDCLSFLPAPSSIFTPIPAVGQTTASVASIRITPKTSSTSARREVTRSHPVFSRSPTLEQPRPSTGTDAAIQSPITLQIDIQPFIPEDASLLERQSPCDNVTEIVDAVARNLRRTPPANTSKMQLRSNTSSQRKTQPLFTSYLPDIVKSYNSPKRRTQKQLGTKFNKIPTGKRKTHNPKKRRSPFRFTTLLYIWATLFTANTIQYSTVNKQQLPEFKGGAAFVFKYQVVTSESDSQVRIFSPLPTLSHVNIDGVHAIFLGNN